MRYPVQQHKALKTTHFYFANVTCYYFCATIFPLTFIYVTKMLRKKKSLSFGTKFRASAYLVISLSMLNSPYVNLLYFLLGIYHSYLTELQICPLVNSYCNAKDKNTDNKAISRAGALRSSLNSSPR